MNTKLSLLCLFLTWTTQAANVPFGTPFSFVWDDPGNASVNFYTVYEQTPQGPRFAERSDGPTKRVPITPRPLGLHTYVVTANYNGLESAPSLPFVIEVVPVIAAAVPGQVESLTGVVDNNNLTLTWAARPASEKVTAYSVIETRNGVTVSTSSVPSPPLMIVNLSPGVHNYQVYAVNAAGIGPKSIVLVVNHRPPQNVPFAPVNLRLGP